MDDNQKKLEFIRNRIKEQLKEIRLDLGERRYQLYIDFVDATDCMDELRDMADLELQIDLAKYSRNIKEKLNAKGVTIGSIEESLEGAKEIDYDNYNSEYTEDIEEETAEELGLTEQELATLRAIEASKRISLMGTGDSDIEFEDGIDEYFEEKEDELEIEDIDEVEYDVDVDDGDDVDIELDVDEGGIEEYYGDDSDDDYFEDDDDEYEDNYDDMFDIDEDDLEEYEDEDDYDYEGDYDYEDEDDLDDEDDMLDIDEEYIFGYDDVAGEGEDDLDDDMFDIDEEDIFDYEDDEEELDDDMFDIDEDDIFGYNDYGDDMDDEDTEVDDDIFDIDEEDIFGYTDEYEDTQDVDDDMFDIDEADIFGMDEEYYQNKALDRRAADGGRARQITPNKVLDNGTERGKKAQSMFTKIHNTVNKTSKFVSKATRKTHETVKNTIDASDFFELSDEDEFIDF